ncbi:MAG: acetate kinase [Chlamydiales bacterium]
MNDMNQDIVLAINTGSSSIKATLFRCKEKTVTRFINIEVKNIGREHPVIEIKRHDETSKSHPKKTIDTKEGFKEIFSLIEKEIGIEHIKCIGHRYVHGGNTFRIPTRINSSVLENLSGLNSLAPLHNPYCLEGIDYTFKQFGEEIPQFAIFDTAFFAQMPKRASLYAIPHGLTEKYHFYRYGFHGISHHYLWRRYSEEIRAQGRIITLHLGNGCSATAINNGCAMDTSMGFTPLEGLMMGTRSGDIDPSVLSFLCEKEGLQIKKALEILNTQSGLLGVSGISSDMVKVISAMDHDEKARFAVDLFCYRIKKYIGAFTSVLEGVDALVFSGGIGENSPLIRERILQEVSWLGFSLDPEANTKAISLDSGQVARISKIDSPMNAYVIATDENASIAIQSLESLD